MPTLVHPAKSSLTELFSQLLDTLMSTLLPLPGPISPGEQWLSRIHEELTREERLFIVSIKEGKPQWDLPGIPGIEDLPAVQWKLQNIHRMTPMKHRQALPELHRCSANTDSAGLDRHEGSSQSLSLLFHEFENFL